MSTVDLRQITETRPDVQTLSGQERGANARKMFNLDVLDGQLDSVRIVVPPTIRTISPSFLQGMLTGSVLRFGSRERFMEHYVFDAPAPIRDQIDEVVGRILGRTQAR